MKIKKFGAFPKTSFGRGKVTFEPVTGEGGEGASQISEESAHFSAKSEEAQRNYRRFCARHDALARKIKGG